MTTTKPVSPLKFVEELQAELSAIYGKPSEITIGKNKLLFSVGAVNFRMEKNREKLDDSRISIIECTSFNDMFPYSVLHDRALTDYKYYPRDVIGAVAAIDAYLMEKVGFMPVCADYSLLRWALLPMFMSDFNNLDLVNETQRAILEIMLAISKDPDVAEGKRFLVPFVARNTDTDEDCACLLFTCEGSAVTIHRLKLSDGKLPENEKDVNSYTLQLDDYPGIQLSAAVRKLFRDLYDFRMCDWSSFSAIRETATERLPVIDPEEELRYLISNKPYYD